MAKLRQRSILLGENVVERLLVEIGGGDFELDRVAEGELLLGALTGDRVGLLVERVEVVAEVADLDHSFGAGLVFFDVNTPVADAGDGAFEDLADARAHVFHLLELF